MAVSTIEEARDALTGFVKTAWDAATSSAPLLYENLKGQRPPDPPALWARVHVRHFQGERASLGANNRFRRNGRVYVQVFLPVEKGMETLDQAGQALMEAFEDAGGIDNIWFRDSSVREVGSDGTYYQVNVETDFTWDRVT